MSQGQACPSEQQQLLECLHLQAVQEPIGRLRGQRRDGSSNTSGVSGLSGQAHIELQTLPGLMRFSIAALLTLEFVQWRACLRLCTCPLQGKQQDSDKLDKMRLGSFRKPVQMQHTLVLQTTGPSWAHASKHAPKNHVLVYIALHYHLTISQ